MKSPLLLSVLLSISTTASAVVLTHENTSVYSSSSADGSFFINLQRPGESNLDRIPIPLTLTVTTEIDTVANTYGISRIRVSSTGDPGSFSGEFGPALNRVSYSGAAGLQPFVFDIFSDARVPLTANQTFVSDSATGTLTSQPLSVSGTAEVSINGDSDSATPTLQLSGESMFFGYASADFSDIPSSYSVLAPALSFTVQVTGGVTLLSADGNSIEYEFNSLGYEGGTGALFTQVPEPSIAILLALSSLGFFYRRR